MSDPIPDRKINKKKLENLERLKKKKEIRISKSKQKKLAQIAERKRTKQTRESLVDELQQYQLDVECFKLLASTSGKNATDERIVDQRQSQSGFTKKLRCVSKDEFKNQTAKRQQKGYIETDSSSDESGKESIKEIEQVEQNLNAKLNMQRIKEFKFDNSQLILKKIKEEEAEKAKENRKKLKLAQINFYQILSKIKGQHVFVERSDEIEKQKRCLPINADEQQIVEAINENSIIIISGETGSGKTTQVPQFLYEGGYTSNGHLIGVTEPRRIAAISMANRVGQELGASELASYQIKYEGNRTEQTKILFMTDGVLLKELLTDCTLSRYSVIIIDEAHERSIYSDVLIGLLSRICLTRLKKQYPLKLIIMSATLRLNDFLQEKLFPNNRPKVVDVDSRQFPVSIYFERRTPQDYLDAAFKKICKIHEQYPPGGILVFLSGQNEVHQLIKKLERKYSKISKEQEKMIKSSKYKKSNKEIDENNEMTLDYDEFGIYDMDQNDLPIENSEIDEIEIDQQNTFPTLICLPLYSLLPSHLQKRVFLPNPDDGSRICIVATNVAETSLTIPNITYVVDSGKEKRREYDPITGVSRFIVDWCSKASANQRSGRAGRVKPGNAYRLYSSAVYEDMQSHSTPEILNKPIEQLVLFLKSMGFRKLANFPFPTSPKPDQLKSAESRLIKLGALTKMGNETEFSQITPLGCTLVQIPLDPGFAKMLVTSFKEGLLPYALTLVTALSVREPVIPISTIQEKTIEETKTKMTEMIKQRQLWSSIGEAKLFGDLTVLLHLIGAADYEEMDYKKLLSMGIRPKALDEINKLRSQLVGILNTSSSLKDKLPTDFRMQPPNQQQLRKLRQILVACFPEKIAKRVDDQNSPKGAYKTQVLKEFVYLDNSSVIFKEKPDYVLYQEIIQMEGKKVLQNLIIVDHEWIPNFLNFQSILGCF